MAFDDGSAGDADYGRIGGRYTDYRRPDPRIAAAITAALGEARSVLNIGAGAGSYEPRDRDVTAVEPSATMRAQRASDLPAAVDAVAEDLPFGDDTFDAAMTTFSVHQWLDIDAGLAEIRRVTRGPIVVLTCDPALLDRFWINDYLPEVLAAEAQRYPTMERLTAALGGRVDVTPVPVPADCTDGFTEAFYGRPEKLLDPGARLSCSSWSFVPADVVAAAMDRLHADLTAGRWDRRHGSLRSAADFDGSLVLVVGH